MISNLKNVVLSFMLVFMLGLSLAPVLPAGAQTATPSIQGGLNCGADLKINEKNCPASDSAATDLNKLITTILNIFSVVVGVIAVIMIIIGGLKYIMSGGDSGNVTGAKNTILYAIIGLVVVALAQAIVKFVLSNTPTA